MRFPYSSGILLHPQSFHGKIGSEGIGVSYSYIDWLDSMIHHNKNFTRLFN